MTDHDLVWFATEFRKGILDGTSSSMMCFAVVAPLAGLLRVHGIDTRVIEGDVGGDFDCNHVWLELPDGRVLDPTADQFNEGRADPFPSVYLGPPIKEIHSVGGAADA